jgi:glucokinase
MKTALVSEGVVYQSSITPMDSESGLLGHLPVIEGEIFRLLSTEQADRIGIAFPGIVDPIRKRVLSGNGKYLDALGFEWEAWAGEQFGLQLVMDNDANAALLGETAFGCAVGSDNAVIMILGTGIGSAALIQGKLLRGKHFQAGCLGGHFSIEGIGSGTPCNCGSVGCAETSGSGWGMARAVRMDEGFAESGLSSEEIVDFRALEKWDAAGDALAVRIMNRCINSWSTCAINLIHAYDPDVLILSGGVIRCGRRIVNPITENVHTYAWTPWGKVDVRVSDSPEHSVLLGLHYLATQEE